MQKEKYIYNLHWVRKADGQKGVKLCHKFSQQIQNFKKVLIKNCPCFYLSKCLKEKYQQHQIFPISKRFSVAHYNVSLDIQYKAVASFQCCGVRHLLAINNGFVCFVSFTILGLLFYFVCPCPVCVSALLFIGLAFGTLYIDKACCWSKLFVCPSTLHLSFGCVLCVTMSQFSCFPFHLVVRVRLSFSLACLFRVF